MTPVIPHVHHVRRPSPRPPTAVICRPAPEPFPSRYGGLNEPAPHATAPAEHRTGTRSHSSSSTSASQANNPPSSQSQATAFTTSRLLLAADPAAPPLSPHSAPRPYATRHQSPTPGPRFHQPGRNDSHPESFLPAGRTHHQHPQSKQPFRRVRAP
jgi:hypothetical protein